MVKSIYGFAQGAQTSSQAVTNALRLYQRAIAQGAGSAGTIDNPDIYVQAREAYLAPLADNVQVSTKIAESINEENRLRDKINDVNLASSVFKESVNDTLKKYAQSYYKNPSNLVMTTAFVYNTAVDELAGEIESRKAAGQGVGDLESLMNSYSDKANKMTRLARQVLASGTPQNPNAYGWFIKTNPDDGSIISLELDGADSSDKQSGFTRTAQYYGNIPVWTNTMVDETGKTVARIGQNKYELQANKDGGKILKNVGKQYGGFFKGWLPGGESPADVKEKNRTLNLGGIEFGDILRLPTGSIAKDSSGSYYYYGADGVYKAPNKDNLTKFLNNTGVISGDIDANAYPISRDEVKTFGSFIDDSGKSRIIDDKFLGSLSSAATTTQPILPSLDKEVSGTISAAPLPSTKEPDTTTPAFEVPRKNPGIKEEAQVGSPTIQDTMKSQAEQFGTLLSPVFKPFKNLFGKK
jgi:hypothetical protein